MRAEKSRAADIRIWALIILVYLAAFIFTERNPVNRLMVDSAEYTAAAKNLLESGVIYAGDLKEGANPLLYSRRPPGYPVLILLAGINDAMVVLLQVALVMIGGWFVWQIAGFLFPQSRYRFLLVLLYFLYPAEIIYSQMIMSEILFQFLLLFSFWALTRFLRDQGAAWILAMNIGLGLAVLTKPILVYFWIPNLLYHAWIYARTRRLVVLIAGGLPLLVVSAWSGRNAVMTGYFHFSSIQASQMRVLTGSDPISAVDESEMEEHNLRAFQVYLERFIFRWPRTLEKILIDPLFLFLDPGRFDIFEFLNMPHDVRSWKLVFGGDSGRKEFFNRIPLLILIYLLVVGFLNVLILAGFLYFVFTESQSFEWKIFFLLVISYVLAAVIFGAVGASRYRLPLEPLLILSIEPMLSQLTALFRRDT